MSSFGKLHPLLQSQIVHSLGWSDLRPVQDLSIEAITGGKNCVILAPTAGGKTEAAFFPTISQILAHGKPGLQVAYISPLKALLNNQEERVAQYTEMVSLRSFKWHGDTAPGAKKRFAREPAEILLTTPESLEVILSSGSYPLRSLFRDFSTIIIDEIHALAATDRGAQLMALLERISHISGKDIQRIGLSATVGNPQGILEWMQGSSMREGALVDPPKAPSKRAIQAFFAESEAALIDRAAKQSAAGKNLVFCENRKTAESIGRRLQDRGVESYVHHSSLSLETRTIAEEEFARGQNVTIVSTSTMELGIDVGDLDRVLQFQTPATVSSFLQRLGRTGRREGAISNTTFYISEDPWLLLLALAIVEAARSGYVEPVRFGNRSWHLLFHQIMVMALDQGVGYERLSSTLLKASPFHGFTEEDLVFLLNHLVSQRVLDKANGVYLLGEAAEQQYGKYNFMELYAVFTAPVEYSVQTRAGEVLGSLQRDFAERLFPHESSFLLGGRPWMVVDIFWDKYKIIVEPAPAGVSPKWTGSLPRIISRELARRIQSILETEQDFDYIEEEGRKALGALRTEFRGLLQNGAAAIEGDRSWRWWNFSGGLVNYTLRYCLEHLLPSQAAITADNYGLTISKLQNPSQEARALLSEFLSPDFLEENYARIAASIPNYRLSKFQEFLPEACQKQLLMSWLFDVEQAKADVESFLG